MELTPEQVERIRAALRVADETRPTTIADEQAHYHSLIMLRAVVELVLDDAAAGDR